MSESEKNLNLTRRKFMAVSSAAIAAPFVMNMTGSVPHIEAAEKAAEKPYEGMKSIVIYYSQSGNTKKIAQAVQKGIISQTGQCDLVRVKEIKPEDLKKYDLVGIGAPTWGSCPSPIVIYFCKSLPSSFKGKHFFFYTTHGKTPGRTIIRGVQPLQEAGMTVIGWRDWYGGSCLRQHPKPWFTDGHPDEIDLAEAEYWGKALVVHSYKISGGQTDLIPKLPSKEAFDQFYGYGIGNMDPGQMMGGMPSQGGKSKDAAGRGGVMPAQTTEKKPYPLPFPTSGNYVMQIEGLPAMEMSGEPGRQAEGMPGMDMSGAQPLQQYELRINGDKCIRCKLCVRGCPYYNIDDTVSPFAFKTQDCEKCLFCESLCPTGAIECDFQPTDPDALKKQMAWMDPALQFAEATGRFRRLVKEEDVGWKTPWEVATGHPRLKELP